MKGPAVLQRVLVEDGSELVSRGNAMGLLDKFGLPAGVTFRYGESDCVILHPDLKKHLGFHVELRWRKGARWCLHGLRWGEPCEAMAALFGWLRIDIAEPVESWPVPLAAPVFLTLGLHYNGKKGKPALKSIVW